MHHFLQDHHVFVCANQIPPLSNKQPVFNFVTTHFFSLCKRVFKVFILEAMKNHKIWGFMIFLPDKRVKTRV